MFNRKTRLQLCDLLIAVGEEEKNLEVLRQILSEQQAFEPYAAFKRIDRGKSGHLTITNIGRFLSENGLEVNEKLISAFVKFHDTDDDLKLSYPEYLRQML